MRLSFVAPTLNLLSYLKYQQVTPSKSTENSAKQLFASYLFLDQRVQLRRLNVCQVEWDSMASGSVSSRSAAADSTLDGKLFLSAHGEEGGWVGGQRQGATTYCRFRSYSCGGTVIIPPPPLLNSLILSYISKARGQESLQYINRSTLCKGNYCICRTS